MNALEARTRAKAALETLGCPIKFRGETLPNTGTHIVIDFVGNVGLETLEIHESNDTTQLQIGCWVPIPASGALNLASSVQTLLENVKFYRVGAMRLQLEDEFAGAMQDYDTLL